MRLISLVDFFLPATARSDLRKAQPTRLLIAICLVAVIFEPIMSLRHFLLANNAGAGVLTLVVALFGMVVLAAIRRGLPPRITLDIVIAIVVAGSTAVSVARGGFYISTLIPSTLIPLLTGLIGLRRATIVWASIAGVVLATLAVTTLLGLFGLHRETAIDAGPLLVFLVATTVISLVHVDTRQDLEREAETLQRRITMAQRLEALGNLAAGVAHDFNNLLTVFAAAGEAMVEELPAGHALRADADAVRDAAARGATIARQLLVFSRPQTHESASFDLAASITAMEPLLRRALPEAIALSLESSPNALHVTGDPGQLMSVILNLVVNARDAMSGTGTVRIVLGERGLSGGALGALPPGRYATLEVRDDGAGIAADVLPHIFEPFFTTKTRERGSGLGLATAYGNIRAMKGVIGVESALGRGTTFEILLPLLDVARAPQVVVSERLLPASRGRVLVVDDQPELVTAARRLLERDFDVVTAIGAEQALATFGERADIDVVLTDVCMPSMGGIELAARLRKVKPSLKIVYMTGYSDDETIARELEAGIAGLIHKPFNRTSLKTEIERLLARRPARSSSTTPPAPSCRLRAEVLF